MSRSSPRLGLLVVVLALLATACTATQPTHDARPTARPSVSPTATTACPRAPVWHGPTTFGVSISTRQTTFAEAIRAVDAKYGAPRAVRVFDPTLPPPTAWGVRAPFLHGRVVVTSFRMPPQAVLSGRYDAQLTHFFREAPADITLFWSYNIEPEAAIDRGEYTAAEFRSAFRHLVRLAGRLCRSNEFPTLTLTGWTASTQSGRNWRDYYPGDDYVSVLAWDPYNHPAGVPSAYEPPATLFGPLVGVSRSAGKSFGIAETGSQLAPTDAGGLGRSRWLGEVHRYLEQAGAAFVLYYDSIGTSGADYRLQDPASITRWRAISQQP